MLAALPSGETLKISQVAPSRPMNKIFVPSSAFAHHAGAMLYVPRHETRLPST